MSTVDFFFFFTTLLRSGQVRSGQDERAAPRGMLFRRAILWSMIHIRPPCLSKPMSLTLINSNRPFPLYSLLEVFTHRAQIPVADEILWEILELILPRVAMVGELHRLCVFHVLLTLTTLTFPPDVTKKFTQFLRVPQIPYKMVSSSEEWRRQQAKLCSRLLWTIVDFI